MDWLLRGAVSKRYLFNGYAVRVECLRLRFGYRKGSARRRPDLSRGQKDRQRPLPGAARCMELAAKKRPKLRRLKNSEHFQDNDDDHDNADDVEDVSVHMEVLLNSAAHT